MSLLRRLDKSELRRVSAWAKQELNTLRSSSNEPICVSLKNGNYTVGTYLVEKTKDGWTGAGKYFASKRSAIFYCAFLHTKQYNCADQLVELEQKASYLEADKELFRFRLDKAHLRGDFWQVGLYSSRYEETKGRLRLVRAEVEKILNLNKYNNILG